MAEATKGSEACPRSMNRRVGATLNAASTNPTNQGEERARTKVKEAIHALPTASTKAYRQAKTVAPQLVATETDPLMFVRRCDGDIRAAAARLCLYWDERLRVFGPDLAFRPLDLSGKGALTPNDILSLQAGFPAILPDSQAGRKVLLCDRRKAIPISTNEGRLRCAFYAQNILAQSDPRTQTEGYIILVVLVTPRFPPLDQVMSNRLIFNGGNIFPTKPHLHFLVLPPIPKAGKNAEVQNITSTNMKEAAASKGYASIHLHVEKESSALGGRLIEKVGLSESGIPQGLGGTWRTEDHFKWCKAQEAKDVRENEQKSREQGGDGQDIRSNADQNPVLTEAEKREKRRLADVMHSRRKRERKKKQVEGLENEAKQVTLENENLKKENARLLDLLQQAQRLVGLPATLLESPPVHSNTTGPAPMANAEGSSIGSSASTSQLLEHVKTLLAANSVQQPQVGQWTLSSRPVPAATSQHLHVSQAQLQLLQDNPALLRALLEQKQQQEKMQEGLRLLSSQTNSAPLPQPHNSAALPIAQVATTTQLPSQFRPNNTVPASASLPRPNPPLQQVPTIASPNLQINGTASSTPTNTSAFAIGELIKGILNQSATIIGQASAGSSTTANASSLAAAIIAAQNAPSSSGTAGESSPLHRVVSAIVNLPQSTRSEVILYLVKQAIAEQQRVAMGGA